MRKMSRKIVLFLSKEKLKERYDDDGDLWNEIIK